MAKIEKKEEVSFENINSYLKDVFQNLLITKNHLDTKLYWLLGISAALMSISLQSIINNTVNSTKNAGIIVIFLFSLTSFIICLISLDKPDFIKRKKEKITNNYMFYNNLKNKSGEEIFQTYKNIKNYDALLYQYSINFYELINHNIIYKKNYFVFARNILVIGTILGGLMILFQLI